MEERIRVIAGESEFEGSIEYEEGEDPWL